MNTNSSFAQESEIYNISLPRKVSDEFNAAQEEERQWRIEHGVDPLTYGKMFRCMTELMQKGVPNTLLNDARSGLISVKQSASSTTTSLANSIQSMTAKISAMAANLFDSAGHKKDDLVHKAEPIIHDLENKAEKFAVNTNTAVKEIQHDASIKSSEVISGLKQSASLVEEKAQDFAVATNNLASDVVGNINHANPSSFAAEEKERTRRLSLSKDPVVEGRKHRVEEELTHKIKPVN